MPEINNTVFKVLVSTLRADYLTSILRAWCEFFYISAIETLPRPLIGWLIGAGQSEGRKA